MNRIKKREILLKKLKTLVYEREEGDEEVEKLLNQVHQIEESIRNEVADDLISYQNGTLTTVYLINRLIQAINKEI